MTVKGVCRDCLDGRKMRMTEDADTQNLAREMLKKGIGEDGL